MRWDDVSRRADRLAEAREVEAGFRRLLETDVACDPVLMFSWQLACGVLSRVRASYESALTDWLDGDKGELLQ